MNSEKNVIDYCNTKLKELYGTDETMRPIFRLVWSDSQIEKRFGTISEYYGSIFLRETKGIHEVPKYTYIQHRWILEKLMFAMTDEVIGLDLDNRCYEPVYTFQDKFGEALPVEWWAVEMIVKRLLGVMSGDVEKMTQQDCDREEDRQYWKEVAYTEDVLANEQGGDIALKLGSREAVIVQ